MYAIRRTTHDVARFSRETAESLLEAAYTLYLFSESNIVGVLCPAIAMGVALVGMPDAAAFLEGFVWLELHLLAFEIMNQVTGIEEDKISKPHRPIPSGRISPSSARALYVCVVTAALLGSARHGIAPLSIAYVLAITVYNEGGLARFWFLKSALGGLGYVTFCWGTAICFGNDEPLTRRAIWAVACEALIFLTTGHAQDFRDRDGDKAIGRGTLALLLPQSFARWSLSALLLAWSTVLWCFWVPPVACIIIVYGLAGATATSFLVDYSQDADQRSYGLYNLWLVSCNVLPLFDRLKNYIA